MSDWKPFVRFLGGLLLIIVILSLFGLLLGWITLPGQKASVQNVEEQFRVGYELHNSLTASANSVCTAQKAYDAETDPTFKSQRQTQLLAYETNYARLAASYDAWASNIFQGKVIRPADLPNRAPSLSTKLFEVCPQITPSP